MTFSSDPAELIPHRDTMLLVDKVLEVVPGERAVVAKTVSIEERWYQRPGVREAAPEHHAYPHAALLESFNQACAVLVMTTWRSFSTGVLEAGVPMLGTYNNVRFGRPVLPGETMVHHIRIEQEHNESMVLTGESFVGEDRVLTVGHGLVVRRPAQVLGSGRVPEGQH
ncbi:3-hydroxyacyl-ACP dehydratase FabZ family protein [Streptomyces palmae]|uniref:Beta-hydroxyacyl-ACP dehydratase n=1 Tax=Streptomyces palmae TaxID=1701085 RepID=A0A4Z0HK40_9ACTN|nr:beta-hydroxyacyl-ACP dehydratase [Streptomyces palmae]TGB19328.1 beta-hydroxyacyl-ACP dehydratase [Streptomyces palmae]